MSETFPQPAAHSPPPKTENGSARRRGGALKVVLLTIWCLCASLTVLVVGGFYWGMRHSGAFDASLSYLTRHPAVIAELGPPAFKGLMPSGNIQRGEGAGVARLEIPLLGPKGSAKAIVFSRKSPGAPWAVVEAILQKDGKTLELTPVRGPQVTPTSL